MNMRIRLAAGLCLGLAATAGATPLRMDYCVTDIGGGLFEYEIALILDNNDGSWFAGNGFGWMIFGDAQNAMSPIADFVMDPGSFPIGPWTTLGSSSGFHNGPTLHFVLDPWVPTAVGETLTWRGTSATNLPQGQMIWSSIFTTGGASIAEFIVANSCSTTCYPDCNKSGGLSIADFICFQAEYVAGNLAYADCNQSGGLSIADFICFQAEYVAGCP